MALFIGGYVRQFLLSRQNYHKKLAVGKKNPPNFVSLSGKAPVAQFNPLH
jgi:hypothetical protein